MDEFSLALRGPTVLVLDNASIHKAHLVQARQAAWAARGLTLLFLPPYSPELNRIELLFATTSRGLWQPLPVAAVEHVLQRVGSDYTITFA